MTYKLKPRSSSWFCRFLNIFGGKYYWMTIGDTIYYPDFIKNPELHTDTLEHEDVHREQYKKYGIFGFLFLYVVGFPFPVFFAYFRWKLEREAYLTNLKNGETVDEVVDSLWGYWMPWPKCLMRRWFKKELAKK